jgi:biotin carboxyl carrier protein
MKINVAVGDQVEADTTLLILEAVKMENEIKAGFAGTVKEISVAQGGVVAAGDTLVVIG